MDSSRPEVHQEAWNGRFRSGAPSLLAALLGPSRVHWPFWLRLDLSGSTLCALDCTNDILLSYRHCENAIYCSTIDYMVAAYGPYAASATGGNGFARDFLAGIAALYSTPMYSNIDPNGYHLEYASTILECLAFLVTIPVYVFYWKGPQIRKASKFAMSLDQDRKDNKGRRISSAKPEQLQPHNL